MITPEEKKLLTVYLKNGYVDDVLKDLAEHKILSRTNKPYTASTIRGVLCGTILNVEVEKSLLRVYEAKKAEHEKLSKHKKKILK